MVLGGALQRGAVFFLFSRPQLWRAGRHPKVVKGMKPGIHPKYEQTTITCSCGAVYHVGSTKQNLRVEICSACHPIFTGGQQRIVDTGGRVERFKRRYGL